MEIKRSFNSCGILEVEGISSCPTDEVLRFVASKISGGTRGAFLTFTAPITNTFNNVNVIESLEKKLKELKLGKVLRTSDRRNPNSGNKITVLIVELMMSRWKKYYQTLPEWYRDPVGKKFRVIKNEWGHNAKIGDIITLTSPCEYGYRFAGSDCYITLSELEYVEQQED